MKSKLCVAYKLRTCSDCKITIDIDQPYLWIENFNYCLCYSCSFTFCDDISNIKKELLVKQIEYHNNLTSKMVKKYDKRNNFKSFKRRSFSKNCN